MLVSVFSPWVNCSESCENSGELVPKAIIVSPELREIQLADSPQNP